MKTSIITILFFCVSLLVNSQDRIVSGFVYNDQNQPMKGVKVYQSLSFHYSTTNQDGWYILNLNSCYESSIEVNTYGYQKIRVPISDTTSTPINIYLSAKPREYKSPDSPKFKLAILLKADIYRMHFDDFKSILGDDNINLMNQTIGVLNYESQITYKKYQLGLSYGFEYSNENETDSVNREFNTSQYGLHLGYNLIETSRFIVTPKVSLNYNRYRLINTALDRKQTLTSYINNRDLDLRIHQLFASIGTNILYKINGLTFMSKSYSIGLYAGYCFKLNETPWLYSLRNRLTSSNHIDLENIQLGFIFGMHL